MARQAPAKKPVKIDTGASASKVNIKTRLDGWIKDHRRVSKDSFKRLMAQPINSIVTWLVIGIALALPVGLYVALGNVQELSHRWDGDAQISLFLHQRVSAQSEQRLQQQLRSWPEIESLHIISKEQALEEFQAISGFADVLQHLDHNPLPTVIEIGPTPQFSDVAGAEKLLKKLQALPPVELAKLDLQWVQRLTAMLEVGQRLALGLVILLSMGVLLVIGNTIRLEIENRRDEIIVTKLVGATDAYVRRPFLYTGLWYGLGGGFIASIIIAVGLAILNKPVATLAGLYQSDYMLLGLSFSDMVSLWMMAGILGFFGAWFSVSKHLDAMEPR
ncbi:MAG: cell division protein FtsX [Pseudomonadales bacterium]|nr:cell division protein FtsX [Pseudomonadales bacterium]